LNVITASQIKKSTDIRRDPVVGKILMSARDGRLDERWMREALTALKGAIEKFKRADEGDFKQALMIADNATETIMRNYLIFKCNENTPYDYPSLLRKACEKAKISSDIIETIELFRLIRDGFSHQNISKIERGLRSTTMGLTLERSYLEEYLKTVCMFFEVLTGVRISI
jgi:HEPN domain-containing protein